MLASALRGPFPYDLRAQEHGMVKVRIARPDQVFNLILGILKQNSMIRITRVLPLSKFGRDPQQDHSDGHSDYIIFAAMQPGTTDW